MKKNEAIFDENVFKEKYPIAYAFCQERMKGESPYFGQAFFDTYADETSGKITEEIDVLYNDDNNEDRSFVFLFDGEQKIIEFDLNNID